MKVEPAGYCLSLPAGWTALRPAARQKFPDNVCFPRFTSEDGNFDSVLVRPRAPSLDEAVANHIGRETGRSRPNEKTVEVSRTPFVTQSGVKGVQVVLRREFLGPGSNSLPLERYIFALPNGDYVCLGYVGWPSAKPLVLASLHFD